MGRPAAGAPGAAEVAGGRADQWTAAGAGGADASAVPVAGPGTGGAGPAPGALELAPDADPAWRGALRNRPSSGVSLIFAPRYRPRTFVHFSWRGESCRMRDYSGGVQRPEVNPGLRSAVEAHIRYELQVPHSGHPTGDVVFWYEQIRQLNRRCLRPAP